MLREALSSLVALSENGRARFRAVIVVDLSSPAYLVEVQQLVRSFDGRLCSLVTSVEPTASRGAHLNAGLDLATADFVGILDDDDVYLAAFGDQLVGYLTSNPGVGLAYGIGHRVYGVQKQQGFEPVSLQEVFNYPFSKTRLAAENFIPPCTVLFRRQLIVEHGVRFDDSLQGLEDWAFFIDLAAHTEFHFLPVPVAEWRSRGRTQTGLAEDATRREAARLKIEGSRYGREFPTRLGELADLYKLSGRTQNAERRAETAERRLSEVLGSRSWRVTRILRRLVGSHLPER